MRFPGSIKELRRSVGNLIAITRNRLANRTYVPAPRNAISIETSARCNLACKFCAYPKRGPGAFMDQPAFEDAVDQALDLGYREIWLTPMLGEVFADPRWREKFAYLERQPRLERFGFYTNFIMPAPADVADLSGFSKLTAIHISIYGHDAESFRRVATKPVAQFDRLMANLDALAKRLDDGPLGIDLNFSIRTFGAITWDNMPRTDLIGRLQALRERGAATIMLSKDFDNWGGSITKADVAELGTELTDGRGIYMRGACTVLFATPQIASDGSVRACACRDVDGSLTLGNLRDRPLAELHSWSNPKFRAIVEDQQAGVFLDNCRTCSMYRSIHDHRTAGPDGGQWPVVTLKEAIERMS